MRSNQDVEMVNLDYRDTGIPGVIIRVCSKAKSRSPKVRVSNTYGRFDENDNFSMNLMTFEIVGGEVRIKSSELRQVIDWIKQNERQLKAYWQDGATMLTRDFLDSLSKLEYGINNINPKKFHRTSIDVMKKHSKLLNKLKDS